MCLKSHNFKIHTEIYRVDDIMTVTFFKIKIKNHIKKIDKLKMYIFVCKTMLKRMKRRVYIILIIMVFWGPEDGTRTVARELKLQT